MQQVLTGARKSFAKTFFMEGSSWHVGIFGYSGIERSLVLRYALSLGGRGSIFMTFLCCNIGSKEI
jgi:hypothetical protein